MSTTVLGPNPFELLYSLLQQILDAIARVADRIDSLQRTPGGPSEPAHTLHADYVYAPEDAARFLGLKRSTYNRLTEVDLPKLRSGRARGVDLMAYRGDISHREAEAYKKAKREAVTGPSSRSRSTPVSVEDRLRQTPVIATA